LFQFVLLLKAHGQGVVSYHLLTGQMGYHMVVKPQTIGKRDFFYSAAVKLIVFLIGH
jgi:hypothetical protein